MLFFLRLKQNPVGAVFRTAARRQRSRSLAGSLSRSADWTEELERRLRSREEERTLDCGGSGEYLIGYKGGSQPICGTRRSSCGQISTCGFQDIFSGQQGRKHHCKYSTNTSFALRVLMCQSGERLFTKSARQMWKLPQSSCLIRLFIQSCVLLRRLL